MAQVVSHLPSKQEVQHSVPNIKREKKKGINESQQK
jgi:hypothetical protein